MLSIYREYKKDNNPWYIFLMFLPFICLVIGIISIVYMNNKIKHCVKEVPAIITDLTGDYEDGYSKSYSYTYNGIQYNHNEFFTSTANNQYHVGQTITIKINPDNPNEHIINTNTNWIAIISIGSGSLLLVSFIIADIKLLIDHIIEKRKKE